MLELKHVTKKFASPDGTVTALQDVSLTVSKGEFLTISGPSGCGKTTLLLSAAGLLRPDSGEVNLNHNNLYKMDSEARSKIRAQMVGFVFQQFHLIPYLTVQQNIMAPSLAFPTKKLLERTKELVAYFGLENRAEFIPAQLSTGERQRTALARALLNHPDIILADEPTGNLDIQNSDIVFSFFKQYVKQGGCLLLVTHDTRAKKHATCSVEMRDGILFNHLKSAK
jgi:putative ABC transport system ATP-binding protein